ncbi:MAG: ATP-dependent DNA helicase RecG [Deltaproteobacteria bacterium]|nr:ATP-dependent DNA helicase RecG [Deltaproteobacteria bacterium]
MQDSDRTLEEILGAILKPLEFACRDNFSRIGSVKGLCSLIPRLCEDAAVLNPSHEDAARLAHLKDRFLGFDLLTHDEKKKAVSSALSAVSGILQNHAPEAQAQAMPAEDIGISLNALKTPVSSLKGVGPGLSAMLAKKGLSTVEDFLYRLPIRYEDRSRIKKIRDALAGATELVTGAVLAAGEARYGRRRLYELIISDGTGLLKVKWFHYKLPYVKRFNQGDKLIVFGVVSAFGRQKEIIHPVDIEILDTDEDPSAGRFGSIVPVYSQIESLHQKTIRRLILGVVDSYVRYLQAGAPPDVIKRHGLMRLRDAVAALHFPSAHDYSHKAALAKRSIAFDEFFLLELGLAMKKKKAKEERAAPFNPSGSGVLEKRLRELLPFSLTKAQERVLAEIKADLSSPSPMNRLIQGDVGSGKTIVCFMSALAAIEAGHQAAIMAPTEILAEQHFLLTHKYAESLGIRCALVRGGMLKSRKDETEKAIMDGSVDLVIGTHAIIQKGIEFKSLGLAVIDEQHRFGVEQRAALKNKGASNREVSPHMLIMTATPIPRTLSMTVFGDLDISVIDELPPGRQPVATRLIREKDRGKAYSLILGELKSGQQAYIVYPLVEGSEELPLRDATNMKEKLEREVFKDFRVGLLHGRMKSGEKESVMASFKNKVLDILVSTTVIEVGVDVPNASVMLVEHAERFGLAQLHQLRGRVGRGPHKSYCLLLAQWTNSEDTYRRLKVMEETMDGFRIAEEDLKLRGPGDLIGTRQAGLPEVRVLEALSDLSLIKKARDEAFKYLEQNHGLNASEESRRIKEILKARWETRLELAEVG